MVDVPEKWVDYLSFAPETGMGYHTVAVSLWDGRSFPQAVIVGGQIVEVRGHERIPFATAEITEIRLTHEKWDFRRV
jgi:hypothetical protein